MDHPKLGAHRPGMDNQVQVRVQSVASQSASGQTFVGQVQVTNATLLFTASNIGRTVKAGELITVQVIKPAKDGRVEVAVCGEPSVVCGQERKTRSFLPPYDM